MAEITRQRTGELLRKLFEILLKEPEGLQARLALERLAGAVALTEYEAGLYEAGSRRFEKIVRFATVDCVKAGWLIKNKGTWSISSEGEMLISVFTDPKTFYREAIRLYREWSAKRPGTGASSSTGYPETVETEKAVSITFRNRPERASLVEIEKYLREMNPYDFQELVAGLLRAMGYHVSWVAPPGRDGGVDIFAHTDPLGTRPPRIKVQVKRVVSRVSAEILRAFMELLTEDDVGLFVSTGGFTEDFRGVCEGSSEQKNHSD